MEQKSDEKFNPVEELEFIEKWMVQKFSKEKKIIDKVALEKKGKKKLIKRMEMYKQCVEYYTKPKDEPMSEGKKLRYESLALKYEIFASYVGLKYFILPKVSVNKENEK